MSQQTPTKALGLSSPKTILRTFQFGCLPQAPRYQSCRRGVIQYSELRQQPEPPKGARFLAALNPCRILLHRQEDHLPPAVPLHVQFQVCPCFSPQYFRRPPEGDPNIFPQHAASSSAKLARRVMLIAPPKSTRQ